MSWAAHAWCWYEIRGRTRKVAYVRAIHAKSLCLDGVTMSHLKAASPDATDMLTKFEDSLPAVALQQAFGIWPPHWTMWKCLIQGVVELGIDADCVVHNTDRIRDWVLNFRKQHGLDPSLRTIAAELLLATGPTSAIEKESDECPQPPPRKRQRLMVATNSEAEALPLVANTSAADVEGNAESRPSSSSQLPVHSRRSLSYEGKTRPAASKAKAPKTAVPKQECPVCFKPQANMRRHLRSIHPDIADQYINKVGNPNITMDLD